MKPIFVAGLLTVSLLGCVDQNGPTNVQPSINVVSPDGKKVTFETYAVDVVITHPWRMEGDRVRVDILNPKGHVFKTQTLPLPADGKVLVRLPVRGGYIEDHHMEGLWSAEAYYNNSRTAFAAVPFDVDAR